MSTQPPTGGSEVLTLDDVIRQFNPLILRSQVRRGWSKRNVAD
ncbi:MAG: hypothetical protein ACM3JB_24660 [Acidobacteriaceae bacterium]